MTATCTFIVQAKDHNNSPVVAQGFSDGTILVRGISKDHTMELPAELVRQIRAELESQALERVAAYARERRRDHLVARDRQPSDQRARRMAHERVASAFAEMANKAQAEKES